MFSGSVNVLKDYNGTATTEGFFRSLREVQATFDGFNLPNESYNPNITLYEYQNSHKRLDCLDASVVFSSIPALWNCLTLSGVALYIQNSSTTDAENLDSKFKDATSELNIDGIDLGQYNAKEMLATAINCTVAACEYNNCPTTRPDLEGMNASSAVHEAWCALQSVCDNLEKWTANPDIVGPGILISYIMQAGIALYCWAFLSGYTLAKFLKPIRMVMAINAPSKWRLPTSISPYWGTHFIATLKVALVEFQEAQCFFVLAVQIAALRFNSNYTLFTGADSSWFGFLQDQNSAGLLAVCGAMPVPLTQLALFRANLSSAYTLSLALAATILSIATCHSMTIVGNFSIKADKLLHLFRDVNHLEECGGKTSPRTFCGTLEDARDVLPGGGLVLGYYFLTSTGISIVLSLLLALTIADAVATKSIASLVSKRVVVGQRGIVLLRAVRAFIIINCELVIVVAICFGLHDQLSLYKWVYEASNWGVGQFAALLIWAPVVSKYFYMVVFGLEKASKIRLPSPYRVVRESEANHASRELPGPPGHRDDV